MEKRPSHIDDEGRNQRAFQFINTLIDYEFEASDPVGNIKEWKQRNQVEVVIKAIEYINTSAIQPRKIKIKEIAKFLEYCSFESQEAMQYKWAALLANSVNPFVETISLTVFMELLNQLSENEINLLELLFDESFVESSAKKVEMSMISLLKQFHISPQIGEILVDNLQRLRLIEIVSKHRKINSISDPYFGEQTKESKVEPFIVLSNLGLSFVQQINFEL